MSNEQTSDKIEYDEPTLEPDEWPEEFPIEETASATVTATATPSLEPEDVCEHCGSRLNPPYKAHGRSNY